MKVDYMNNDNEETIEIQKKSPKRILVQSGAKTSINAENLNQDVLIVVSKLKKYIKDKHGLSTSGEVAEKLSDIVRVTCDRAIDSAKQDGRKTLMARDF